MKIAVLTSLYPSPARPREGIFAEERWLRMAARGHEVRIVRPVPWWPFPLGPREYRELRTEPQHESRAGLEIVRPRYLHWPGAARGNARRFAAAGCRALEAGATPDVVIADYAWPAAQAVYGCKARGWPFVVHGRGSDVLQVAGEAGLRAELAAAVQTAGHWCAVSAQLVQTLDELGSARQGHLTANGVDGRLFHPLDQADARRHIGLSLPGRIALVVGHWIERKDPLLALEAAALVPRAELEQIVLIGRGPLEADLRARSARPDLQGRVRFMAECAPAQLAQWYNAADVLLLTSRREGRPNVVLEALACGLPVVATEAGGTAELLGHAARGLVQQRTPQAVADALRAVLHQPREREALCASVAHLDWDASCTALEHVLQGAIQSPYKAQS